MLDRALRKEWDMVFEGSPELVKVLILGSIAVVLDGKVVYRKGWCASVRKTRENIVDDRIVYEFSASKSSLRDWVVL